MMRVIEQKNGRNVEHRKNQGGEKGDKRKL